MNKSELVIAELYAKFRDIYVSASGGDPVGGEFRLSMPAALRFEVERCMANAVLSGNPVAILTTAIVITDVFWNMLVTPEEQEAE